MPIHQHDMLIIFKLLATAADDLEKKPHPLRNLFLSIEKIEDIAMF